MTIEIPEELYPTFLQFLDLSQAAFTEEDVSNMTDVEKQVFIFIENLLGEDRIHRFSNRTKLNEAKDAFLKAISKS